MSILRRSWLRLRALVSRRALENDMQAEMREHLRRATERLIARGLSPNEAAIAARREFGNVGAIQEDARDARGGRWIDSLVGDLRFAVRYFGRNKITVATIISIFALGIGANTALVTFIQSQFLRPAPQVADDESLVRIWSLERRTRTAPWRTVGFSSPELSALASRPDIFTRVAAWTGEEVVLNPGDSIGARAVGAQFVTPGYFAVLGVRVSTGSGFSLSESGGAEMSAVMSFAMAERLYGAASNALGQRVLVNQVPVRVVGVAPPGFQGALRDMGQPGIWIPLSARTEILRVPERALQTWRALQLVARTAPGVTRAQAATVARVVMTRALPDSALRLGMARRPSILPLAAPLPGPQTNQMIAIFGALGFVGVLLLLVTCTNVSSLMVAAALSRRHEIAVRLSLGASRGRIVRQLLTESTLLALAGGAAGLLLCRWLVRLAAGPLGTVEGLQLTPDFGTLAMTLVIALVTGFVFGVSPALHATRGAVAVALHDSGAGIAPRARLQQGFVVAQIVFSLPLLVVMGGMLSMVAAEFHPLRPEVGQRVATVTLRPLIQTAGPENRRDIVDSLIPRLAAHAAVSSVVPDVSTITGGLAVRPAFDTAVVNGPLRREIRVEGAAPGWFALLDIPILLGRDVSLADTAERVWPVVIGDDLARSLWGDTQPIGRTLISAEDDTVRLTVVGVYDASVNNTSTGENPTAVYTAHGGHWRRDALLVRTRGAAAPFLPELRRLIRARAPGLPIVSIETLVDADAKARAVTIKLSALVGAGAAFALLLATLGLYGVIAVAVRQRTREIAIRIAVGAEPSRVAQRFMSSGVRLGFTALLIGLPLTIPAMHIVLGRRLENVNQWLICAMVSIAILTVAGAAAWIPALRASRIDPAYTLRVD
jgi:predicted permease